MIIKKELVFTPLPGFSITGKSFITTARIKKKGNGCVISYTIVVTETSTGTTTSTTINGTSKLRTKATLMKKKDVKGGVGFTVTYTPSIPLTSVK